VIVEQRIRNQLDVGEIGEELEQRVARFGYQDLVSRIASRRKTYE
jgi:hypothetical protein